MFSIGLDNGICVKNIHKTDLPAFVKASYRTQDDTELELCYWRKCWGIRDEIMDILHAHNNEHASIDIEDIPPIIRHLYKFCNNNYWDENGDSIWEYDEILPRLIQQIINLTWLHEYMKEHSEVICYFYDSY